MAIQQKLSYPYRSKGCGENLMKAFRELKDALSNGFELLLQQFKPAYRLIEVDVQSQKVALQIKSKSVRLILSFEEALDSDIVGKLTPQQACLIGGYYGRALRAALEGREALKKAKNMSFLLTNKQGRYKILYQNRNGDIGYIDQRTRREIVEHPLTVANNESVISGFDPSQACYIGILAGISMEKTLGKDAKKGTNELESLLNKKPQLRLVE